ncbi:MAG: hypothetical protein EA369_04180 [Bradymonadales bacterium]|nr:MAG: hypothetical protein EA369_04180 [Bradymonadales bacterium]
MSRPRYEDLAPKLQMMVGDQNPKQKLMVSKGVAPAPPELLMSAWVYLAEDSDPMISAAAKKSLLEYPEAAVLGVLQKDLADWVLEGVGSQRQEESILEALILNPRTPASFLLTLAPQCSERLTQLIVENQERVIETPELVRALEANPKNLKSNTDRLRQFLKLAGIYIPGDPTTSSAAEKDAKADAAEAETESRSDSASAETTEEESLGEEQRMTLQKLIFSLNTGGKIKLALKGNKEARGILIRDTNKLVATSVLKSPRITENEVVHYSGLKNLSEDVVRDISKHPGWTKNYTVKVNLVQHPKTPLTASMQFLKFLNLRDLAQVSKARTVPAPVRKAAKQLLNTKRR